MMLHLLLVLVSVSVPLSPSEYLDGFKLAFGK